LMKMTDFRKDQHFTAIKIYKIQYFKHFPRTCPLISTRETRLKPPTAIRCGQSRRRCRRPDG
jgi:hypothetical protein